MRILLVRHGRSSHVHRGWLTYADIEPWREKYDAAGLMAHEAPPPRVRGLAESAGIVVTSDMPRAIESASLLRPALTAERSALLREVPLPAPGLANTRLPLWAWGVLIGMRWLRDPHREGIGAAVQGRAGDAADWLTRLAGSHDSVMAVTHGAFRRYLADAIETRGWRPVGWRSFTHWSVWELERS